MTVDAKTMCAVCAWRETCAKKFSIKDSAIHCPDYVRDERLGPEGETAAGPAEKHKKIEDPFA